jgi:pimeloyl-ACP methyl ester carboxylesterase
MSRGTNYLLCWALLAYSISATAAKPVTLETRDLMIPALDAGIQLHLRDKHPAGIKSFDSRHIVLFVHGATFPASSTFDVELPGGSWMNYVAERGFDAYALDIRGYGGSTRPAAMAQPPENNAPFADTREAVRDIAAAVDFILARHGVKQLTLIGWSWGTSTTASFAAQHPDKTVRLVLVSPMWLGLNPPPFKGAYRTSTHDSARAFAIAGMPKDRVDEIAPLASFDRWWAATLATDPQGAQASPPVVRSPNGVLQDFQQLWAAGHATYDPAQIQAPTLLAVGEWDAITPPLMAQQLYGKLVNAKERRLVLLSEGTHFMAIEKHRLRLMREVQNFLDESSE